MDALQILDEMNTDGGALAREAAEALRLFAAGKISRAELQAVTKKVNAHTRQRNADLRALKAAHRKAQESKK